MSDTDRRNQNAAPPLPAAPGASLEAKISSRISMLQSQITILQREVRVLQGKAANRDPEAAGKLQKENSELRIRIARLERALFALISDECGAKLPEDAKLAHQALQQAAVEFFEERNIDQELWKNIVS